MEVDQPALAAAVRCALGRPEARLASYTATALDHRIINQVTGGLYRLEGRTEDGTPWELVLKRLNGAATDPAGPFPPNAEPRHYNYWPRESRVFASGFAGHLPAGLAMPRCYGLEPETATRAGIFMEAIAGLPADAWGAGRYGLAARQLGELQGGYLAGRWRFEAPWTSERWLRDVTPPATPEERTLAIASASFTHPWLVWALADAPARLERLFNAREALLAASEALPRTLSHLDCWAPNMIARGDETVLLDWALLGDAAPGEDPANMIYDSVWMLRHPPEGVDALAKAVWDGYLAGLRAGGWTGPEHEIRLGFTASVALRFGMLALALAGAVRDPERLALAESRFKRPAEGITRARAVVAARALGLVDEALSLI